MALEEQGQALIFSRVLNLLFMVLEVIRSASAFLPSGDAFCAKSAAAVCEI
jgi:hypothetical protein